MPPFCGGFQKWFIQKSKWAQKQISSEEVRWYPGTQAWIKAAGDAAEKKMKELHIKLFTMVTWKGVVALYSA